MSEVAPTANAALARLRATRLARNVPTTASAELNPVLTPSGLLGRFLETWEHIFVLCYKATCAVHTPEGAPDGRRMWWPALQDRVIVFDAAEIDRQNAAVIRWAGCDHNISAGRSGDAATDEPCVFTRRGGGTDWRRTSKHRLVALLAHLTLVEEAAKRNLTHVLILEADAVPSLAAEELSLNTTLASQIAQRMGQAFADHPWSVARLSGMFYSKEYAPSTGGGRRRRQCSSHCSCVRFARSTLPESMSRHLRVCQVAPAPSISDRIQPMLERLHQWCDVRDTSAYAVHHTAFGPFLAYLQRLRALPGWLRDNAIDVPAIDNWLPHALPCVYVLPTLVSQPTFANDSQGATGLLRQTSARNFMQYCVRDAVDAMPSPDGVTTRVHKPMKLSNFATRHLYVLNSASAAR